MSNKRLIGWDPAVPGPEGIREYEVVERGDGYQVIHPIISDDEVAAQNKMMRELLIKLGVPKYTVYPNRVVNAEGYAHGETHYRDAEGKDISYDKALHIICMKQEPKMNVQFVALGKRITRPSPSPAHVLVNDVYTPFTMDGDVICFDKPLQYIEDMGDRHDQIHIVVVW